jgi:DNA primase large subunit
LAIAIIPITQTIKMLAARPVARLDNKRRAVLDPRKRQFAKSQWQEQSYEHAMNFYNVPPTGDIALEQFEEWGIARLKGMYDSTL